MRDRTDFGEYMAARSPVLVRSAALLGCSPAEAEDLVQSALLRCYRSWDRVSRARDRDAYVYRTVLNCYAKSRARRWHGERPSNDLLVEREAQVDIAESVANTRLLVQALNQLSKEHREVVVLRYYADLSERQAAEVLGVSVGTVKSRSARGLVRLAEMLVRSNPTLSEKA